MWSQDEERGLGASHARVSTLENHGGYFGCRHLSQFIKVQFVPLVSLEPAADILLCEYEII